MTRTPCIGGQMRRFGDGVDWGRDRFTLDDGLSRAVRTIFKRLFDAGLIYRAERLVNWSPVLQTAISDLEVKHDEVEGELVSFRYGFLDDDKPHIVVANGLQARELVRGLPLQPKKGHLLITDRYPGFIRHQLLERRTPALGALGSLPRGLLVAQGLLLQESEVGPIPLALDGYGEGNQALTATSHSHDEFSRGRDG